MRVLKEISRIWDEKYCLVINYIQHNERLMFVYYSFVEYILLPCGSSCKKIFLSEVCSSYVFA